MTFFCLQSVGLNVYIFLFSELKMNYSKTFSIDKRIKQFKGLY